MTIVTIRVESVNPLTNIDDALLSNNDTDINIPVATFVENIDVESQVIVINNAEQYVYSNTINNYLQNSQNFQNFDENTKIWIKVNATLLSIPIIFPFIILDFYFAYNNKLKIHNLFIYLVITGYVDIVMLIMLIILIYKIDLNTLKIDINTSINFKYMLYFDRFFTYVWSFYGLILGLTFWNSTDYNSCVLYVTVTSLIKFLTGLFSYFICNKLFINS